MGFCGQKWCVGERKAAVPNKLSWLVSRHSSKIDGGIFVKELTKMLYVLQK